MAKFYVTNSIPYVNAEPHIGHALEFIQSDVVNRYHRVLGDDVLYLCGSDENAIKNVQAAEKAGEGVQEFINRHAEEFQKLAESLDIHFDIFQKGSAENHHKASQKLWDLCNKNGDIYKKKYKGLYCVGCEEFKTPSELNENGECPEHPGKKLEEVEEENYFFSLSKYKDRLLALIESNTYHIVPEFRKNEILSFARRGLEDFSISRSNKRAKDWGVPVPGDPTQRIYVWFDALNIYQSGIGFGADSEGGAHLQGEAADKRGSLGKNKRTLTEKDYEHWWPADLHVIGKGIIRFHAVYWPAILMSAGLKLPKGLFVHEYFTVNGQKMSKTLGNVINPLDMVEKYGADALRYYCLAKISPFQDGDFSEKKLVEAYNADLANGLGNLVARVAKLAEKHDIVISNESKTTDKSTERKQEDFSAPPRNDNQNDRHPELVSESLDENVLKHLNSFEFNDALSVIWKWIRDADQKINQEKPWELEGEKANKVLTELVEVIVKVATNLKPFLPEASSKILKQFSGKIKSQTPLFPRI